MTPTVLEKLVILLATQYDQGLPCVDFDGEPVSDAQYDTYVRELKAVLPDSPAFSRGSTSPSNYVPSGNLVVHNPPMTSIEKADGDNKKKIYEEWIKDCCTRLGYTYPPPKDAFTQTFKHDGVAIRINYVKGKLHSAGLRPRDGVNGIDVTENVKYVNGVPQVLPLPVTLSINGELECRISDFNAINDALAKAGEELRKNPRNHTYGSINQQKDPTKTKDGNIGFTGYSITGFDDSATYYTTELERAKWVNQVLKVPFVRVNLHTFADLQTMEEKAPSLDYEVDGIVLKVNNLEDQEQLGHHGDDPTGNPRGALAWKFAEEAKTAEVASIEWNTSRTGRVTPVAVFKTPIQLAGTSVSRATCSNLGWIRRMEIGVGTKVKVIKAGKIIPKVIEVLADKTKVKPPHNCPSCNGLLTEVHGHDDNVDLQCLSNNCLAKKVVSLTFYLSALGTKGLGESKVELMVANKLVKDIADLYRLEVDDLTNNDVFTEREALLALATIHMVKPMDDDAKLLIAINKAKAKKKVIPAWQFFGALGMEGAGKTVGKLLIEKYKDFDKIMDATEADLLTLDGIGPKTAESIVAYFKANRKQVEDLLQYIELELPKTGKLTGKSFVFSGGFDEGKSHWEKAVLDLGGKVSSSVSKNTTYLVAGPGSGSKSEKAQELGVTIIDVKALQKLL